MLNFLKNPVSLKNEAENLFQSAKNLLNGVNLKSDVGFARGKILILLKAETSDPIQKEKLERLNYLLWETKKKFPDIFKYLEIILETQVTKYYLS